MNSFSTTYSSRIHLTCLTVPPPPFRQMFPMFPWQVLQLLNKKNSCNRSSSRNLKSFGLKIWKISFWIYKTLIFFFIFLSFFLFSIPQFHYFCEFLSFVILLSFQKKQFSKSFFPSKSDSERFLSFITHYFRIFVFFFSLSFFANDKI